MNTDHYCIVNNSYIREEVAECYTLFHWNGIELIHDIEKLGMSSTQVFLEMT